MNRFLLAVAASVVISTSVIAAEQQPKDRARLDQIERSLKIRCAARALPGQQFRHGRATLGTGLCQSRRERFSLHLELARRR